MAERLLWDVEGDRWPNAEASQFVEAAGIRWHLQRMGEGPCLLLIHGTGATTHSWRDLAPLLAERFTVVAPDLPGHGFTTSPPDGTMTLPAMANGLAALLRETGDDPALVAGHSAGAAILARMALDDLIAPRALISLNGALLPFGGMPGILFAPVAKLMAATDLPARFFAWRAEDDAVVARLLDGTGSTLDDEGTALYGRLARTPAHVAAALQMMASWDLDPLERDLPALEPRLVLVAGGRDEMVSPGIALRVRRLVPGARVERFPDLGHLAHEERPDLIAALIVRIGEETGVLDPPKAQ